MGESIRLSIVAALLAVTVAACGGKSKDTAVPDCTTGTDNDGDGYGPGCEAGEDCNDFDANLSIDCCSAGNYTGCPCDPASDGIEACFEGPPDRVDNAPCQAGMRRCDPVTSKWSGCGGQVLPDLETCDVEDNDCDGFSDEGVQSACGNCLAGCDSSGVDDEPFPFPPEDPSVDVDGVGLDPNGDLVLDSSTIENHFLWIANDPEGTVSKIDTRTGKEVARYASVSRQVLIDVTGGSAGTVRGWNEDTTANNTADNRPSRTAIDYNNDVWVANRAHDSGGPHQPTITKIRNIVTDCVDRNGNGSIQTSSDVNGDGVIDLASPTEFFAEADECIAFTVVVGANGGNARALAIDAGIEPGDPGDAWVGMWEEQVFYEINGRTGELIRKAPSSGTLGLRPYGAAIDSQGRLWATSFGDPSQAQLVSINTITGAVAPVINLTVGGTAVNGSYGIVVDLQDRVWLAGWNSSANRVYRYDPSTSTTVAVTIPAVPSGESTRRFRGIGLDTHGNVWTAVDTVTDRMVRINADTATVTGQFSLSDNGRDPIGIGVDFDGDVWTVNRGRSTVTRLHIDQTALEPAPHPSTGNLFDSFPVGRSPYTYSDFTGLGLRVVTRPNGDYTVPIQGCANLAPAKWLSVDFDATTPANTAVEIWVRVGDDLATLDAQPIYGPWTESPADLTMPPGPVPDGKYLQLTIRLLSSDGESTPIVHGYSVDWACPGDPIG